MQILVVSAWDGASGLFTVIRSLAERLRPKGVMFAAFCYDGWKPDTPWGEYCQPLFSNRTISLTEVLVRHRFDLVHLIDTACDVPYNPGCSLRRACFRGGVVCNAHNLISVVPPDQFADFFIACSEPARSVLAKTICRPIGVIQNGVDTDYFFPREIPIADRPILGWVGRASDYIQKDVIGFLTVAGNLVQDGYDIAIAGVGPQPKELRLQEWFGERITYHESLNREALAKFYSQIAASGGAALVTSTFEGFHLGVAEAAACGCPVVAARAPGLEWVERDAVGLCYDRYNAIQNVRECLARLREPAFRREWIEAAGRAVREKYDSNRMAEQYWDLYLKAMYAKRAIKGHWPQSWLESAKREAWARALNVRWNLRRLGISP